VVESAAESDQLVIIAVVELRKLAHSIAVDILTVWNAVVFIFIALALILRLFIVFLFIIATLVEQGWVRIIQNMLRVRAHFPESFNKSLGCAIDSRISVVECGVSLALAIG